MSIMGRVAEWTTFSVMIRTHTPDGYDAGNRVKYRDEELPSDGWVKWPGNTSETDSPVEDISTDQINILNILPVRPSLDYLSEVKLPGSDKWYEVIGQPWPWESPLTGSYLGTQVTLKAVE